MKIVHAKNYDEMSQKAAAEFISLIAEKPDALLGLATGSSPVGMYQCMIEAYKAGKISFKNIRSFNLDKYYPITPDNDQSYRYFMDTNLFNAVDIDKNNTPPCGFCTHGGVALLCLIPEHPQAADGGALAHPIAQQQIERRRGGHGGHVGQSCAAREGGGAVLMKLLRRDGDPLA